jgi:hypothetical protein
MTKYLKNEVLIDIYMGVLLKSRLLKESFSKKVLY